MVGICLARKQGRGCLLQTLRDSFLSGQPAETFMWPACTWLCVGVLRVLATLLASRAPHCILLVAPVRWPPQEPCQTTEPCKSVLQSFSTLITSWRADQGSKASQWASRHQKLRCARCPARSARSGARAGAACAAAPSCRALHAAIL